jgi:competence ComEA-like helix-hairpin-helix protein
MPPSERRALLLLLGLGVAGQAVRHLASRPGEPPGQVRLLSTLSPGSPLAQRDSAMRRARPLAPGERVDLDTAAVEELARLPKVGPGLAKTIHAYRQAHGSFGSLEVLDRVPGVGPGLLKTLGPHVSFSGAVGAGTAASRQGTGAVSLNLNTANAADLDSLPGIGPAKAAAILQYRERHGAFVALEQLAEVPGFGVGAVARLRDRVTVR